MEYILNKVVRFEHLFPKSSTNYLKENHYRTYLLKNRIKHYYYRMMPPKHLIQYDKIIDGSIPVIIINYNRCQTLMQMVDWLQNLEDAVSIIIIDNASTYPPLLQYYDSLDFSNVQVMRFEKNHRLKKMIAISQTMQQFDYYVITDSDLIPYHDTKGDILSRMKTMLAKYKDINHVGASLAIHDLPEHYPLKEAVESWESQFWDKPREKDVYDACVDTTFGMYRGDSYAMELYPALRLGKNYSLKHVDWYLDPLNISAEGQHLMEFSTSVSTWNTRLKNALPGLENLNS